MIPILILAAGQSSRMRGVDKLLMDVDGQPLLARQIKMAAHVGQVFVATAPDQEARAAIVRNCPATHLRVAEADEGIGGTLRGAIPRIPKQGKFMVLLSDLIYLKTNDLAALVDVSHEFTECQIWRGATADGKPGHPIIFDDRLRSEFATLRGDHGANQIVKAHQSATHLFRFSDQRARYDLDTPEEWETWRAGQK